MFRLALALGERDPYKLWDELPPGLLEHWGAYGEVEPFGESWTQTAVLAREIRSLGTLIRMVAGDKDAKFPTLAEFLPVAAPGHMASHSSSAAADGENRDRRIENQQAAVKAAFGIK